MLSDAGSVAVVCNEGPGARTGATGSVAGAVAGAVCAKALPADANNRARAPPFKNRI
jgi:hypothetical protein